MGKVLFSKIISNSHAKILKIFKGLRHGKCVMPPITENPLGPKTFSKTVSKTFAKHCTLGQAPLPLLQLQWPVQGWPEEVRDREPIT